MKCFVNFYCVYWNLLGSMYCTVKESFISST